MRRTKNGQKNIIIDDFLQKWYSTVTSVKNRKLLSKFRLSSCKLNAITGKYKNNDNNKLCKMCDLNDIEDEFHFVLVCQKYLILRQKYIKPYYFKSQVFINRVNY